MPTHGDAKVEQLFPTGAAGIELFDEFFESGMEESVSPFLTPNSRKWGVHLPLKSSLTAAFLLVFSFIFSFMPTQKELSSLLLLLTYFFAGIPALISAVEDLFSFEINIDVLMTLAAFLSVLIGSGQEGALLLVLFSFSGSMEEAVRSKAKSALVSLKKLSPTKAWVVEPDGSLIERSLKDISTGTKIHVKAGQVVPLDGVVVEGASSVNLIHLTGESMPQPRFVNDLVPAGARNLEGALTVAVTRISSDSTLARIIQLITQAQEAKPRFQRWLDTISKGYATSIILLSLFISLLLPWLFSIPFLGREGSIYRALAFLIAASPCALIIAIPIAYLSAVSVCAQKGILLKGGTILDALARCTTVAMDKTGTITTGELQLQGIEHSALQPTDFLLSLAYALERNAVHPIAKAIMLHAEEKGIQPALISDFQSIAGHGLQGLYQNQPVLIGRPAWILPQLESQTQAWVKQHLAAAANLGEASSLLVYGNECALFRFKDTLRPQISEALSALKDTLGMRLVMLTGDNQESAEAIAREAGLSEFHADLKPEDKLNYISKEQNLVMVGDGINDAPALARAAVGISMGKGGSTTAVDASDIVLLQDNIELLAWLVAKSRQVVKIVKQNVTVAFAAIICAAIPALLGWIPLWVAVVLHEGGTVVVALNALRLLKKRL